MKVEAELLVKAGYAHSIPTTFNFIPHEGVTYLQMVDKPDPFKTRQYVEVNPYADTLESRKQADALEDWLDNELETALWQSSKRKLLEGGYKYTSNRQWRLDRIKWCIKLLKEDAF